MSLTTSQRLNVLASYEALKNRQMVFLAGRQNGKTRIISRIQETKPVPNAHGSFTLRARHEEDNDIVFVTGGFYGRSDKITPYTFMRQILASQKRKLGSGFWQTAKAFEDLLREFHQSGRVLCIAIDNADLFPSRAFTILKMLNEVRYNKQEIGVAVVVAGDYGKMRLPDGFLKRCNEIQVGPITAATEIAQLIETLYPGESVKFNQAALERVMNGCTTTLDLRKNIAETVKKRRELDADKIDVSLVQLALAA